jgi:uroporphyrinogen decarboxylase
MLTVCKGLFLSLGVDGWQTFSDMVQRLVCEPQVVLETMRIQGEFGARLADRVLKEVEVDAALFSEPICGNHGPLVSPRMFEEFALKSYQPILEVLHQNGVETIIFMTWANARLILPAVVRYGFNCLWAYEVNTMAMDYGNLRREFGRDLRLIGGIDVDKVREGEEAIRREILEKVPRLLADGGYIPLADGRVREDVPYNNYVYYRRLLEEIAQS